MPGRRIVRARRPPPRQSSDLPGAIQTPREVNGQRTPSAGGERSPYQNDSVPGAAGARDDDDEDESAIRPTFITGRGQRERHQAGFPLVPQPGADDDDDDSDGEDDISPPRLFQEFLLEHMAMARSSSRRTNSKLSSQIRPVDDDPEYEFDIAEEDEPRCSACYRRDDPNHPWRRLVTLPCCGTDGREEKSSTRFSAGCILKLAVTKSSCSSENNEYTSYETEPDAFPVKRFYQKEVQNDKTRLFNCPRCRSVLLIKIKGLRPDDDDDDDDSDCECMCEECVSERNRRASLRADKKTCKSISLHLPSFRAKCLFAGRKRGVAALLWRVSLLHHEFLSFEALGGDSAHGEILQLASFGIISRIKSKKSLYRIDKKNQAKVAKLLRMAENASEDDKMHETRLLADFCQDIVHASWRHLVDEYRPDHSARLLNRLCTITLFHFGHIPSLPLSQVQETAVTLLTAFLSTLVIQFVCVMAVYSVVFFGVGYGVCHLLKKSSKGKEDLWWQSFIAAFIIYKLNHWFYTSKYLSWSRFIIPVIVRPAVAFLTG